MKRRMMIFAVGLAAAVAGGFVLARMRSRRAPRLPGRPTGREASSQPVLLYNPHSGSGKADRYRISDEAAARGIEAHSVRGHKKIKKAARNAVEAGCDHLLAGGGDGSLAAVAEVAIDHGVPMSVVPLGTRNHFAMDLGLDRDDPVAALDAAFDGVEVDVDVGRIGDRLFLNNVSFGIYAEAVRADDYREHRAETLAETAAESVEHVKQLYSVECSDGTSLDRVGLLLASNNPYEFIGPPDYGGRAALDTGMVGVVAVVAPSSGTGLPMPSAIRRWHGSSVTVTAETDDYAVAVDGSDRAVPRSVEVSIDHRALRIVLPVGTAAREISGGEGDLTPEALAAIGRAPGR